MVLIGIAPSHGLLPCFEMQRWSFDDDCWTRMKIGLFPRKEIYPPMSSTLKGTRCYLAGSIENGAGEWRETVKRALNDLGIVWLDPLCKTLQFAAETPHTQSQLKQLRDEGASGVVAARMAPIRAVDLRMVDVADFVIARIDASVPTWGTCEELNRAHVLQNKPVLVLVASGLETTPLWLYDMLDSQHFYKSLDDIESYLRFVDNQPKDWLAAASNKKWLLVV